MATLTTTPPRVRRNIYRRLAPSTTAGCSDIPAGDCDCDGNQLDAIGVCGDDYAADQDGDYICDDVDGCVGTYDDCGIYNGPGAIYDCRCFEMPADDCDCDGNQLDALGDCGGDCAADVDGDGICDDVDNCADVTACSYIGPADNGSCLYYDVCGICGGPGLAVGECDCAGNTLDALGVCGGDCAADQDHDGICDDVDPCIGGDLDPCGVCNGQGSFTIADAATSPKAIAIATAANSMPLAFAAAIASLIWTRMVFVMIILDMMGMCLI